MKAEHRKELQTNALADRLGRLVKGVKTGVQSSSLGVWAIVVLILVIIGAILFFSGASRKSRSQVWAEIDRIEREIDQIGRDGRIRQSADLKKARDQLQAIMDKHSGTPAARMARFQLAQLNLREDLSLLPTEPQTALTNLAEVRKEFEKLAEECKNDPYWEPRARLALAQIEEAGAIQDPAKVKKAAGMYKEVADKYPNSAAGKEAADRARELENPRAEALYKQLAPVKKSG